MKKENLPNLSFCTECGDDLENFCFSMKAKDVKAVREQMEVCIKSKKINGEFCSKYYIVKEFEMDDLLNFEL